MCAQSRGADPSILSDEIDAYLDPTCKTPAQFAAEDHPVRETLAALEVKYAGTPKVGNGMCTALAHQRWGMVWSQPLHSLIYH